MLNKQINSIYQYSLAQQPSVPKSNDKANKIGSHLVLIQWPMKFTNFGKRNDDLHVEWRWTKQTSNWFGQAQLLKLSNQYESLNKQKWKKLCQISGQVLEGQWVKTSQSCLKTTICSHWSFQRPLKLYSISLFIEQTTVWTTVSSLHPTQLMW